MKKAPSHFREGLIDRHLGKALAECPYMFDTPEYREWVYGWKRADETLAKQPVKESA